VQDSELVINFTHVASFLQATFSVTSFMHSILTSHMSSLATYICNSPRTSIPDANYELVATRWRAWMWFYIKRGPA
jgi:hypothetical protein